MMSNTKKVFVRELHEIIRVRRSRTLRMHCADCMSDEDFLTLDETVECLRIGTREILRRVEANDIHAADTANGRMLICSKSLSGNAVSNGEKYEEH